MKKWLFFLACFSAVALLGGEGLAGRDVAKLEPVQIIYLSTQDGKITLQTDTGARGSGENLPEALNDLHQTASGYVFLDTTDYLIVATQQRNLIPQLGEVLRPSCRICLTTGQPDMELVGVFLQIHQPALRLKDYLAGRGAIQTLEIGEGMRLVSE